MHVLLRRARSLVLNSFATLASWFRVAWFRLRNNDTIIPWSTRIGAHVRIRVTDRGRLRLGEGVILDRHVVLYVQDGSLTIGSQSFIGTGVVITAKCGIWIGDDALVAEYVTIRDQNHVHKTGVPTRAAGFDVAPIVIGANVWLGAKATVLKGVTIGDGSVVGANAVVTHSLPTGCVAVGVPARVVE